MDRKRKSNHIFYSILFCLLGMLVTACATTGADPRDPYETYNRKMHSFNLAVDTAIVKPTAQLYNAIVPWPVREGANNFFDNLRQVPTIANDLLQGQFKKFYRDVWRLFINTTFGVLGILDVATSFGLEKDHQDFGLTLAKWGDKNSPYVVLPLLGASTIRDSFGLTYDYFLFSVYPHIKPTSTRYALLAYRYVTLRAQLLENEKLIQQASIDSYILQREAYLQRRQFLIDGKQTSSKALYIEQLDEEDALLEGDENIEDNENTQEAVKEAKNTIQKEPLIS